VGDVKATPRLVLLAPGSDCPPAHCRAVNRANLPASARRLNASAARAGRTPPCRPPPAMGPTIRRPELSGKNSVSGSSAVWVAWR